VNLKKEMNKKTVSLLNVSEAWWNKKWRIYGVLFQG
jgi:hypothetical protein